MRVFFQRYAVLESANFPIFTNGNALALVMFGIAFGLWYGTNNPHLHRLSICFTVGATLFVVLLSFVFTAPTIGRLTYVRRAYLLMVHYALLRFMESIDWCTGTNKKGYINHLTAQKLLDYGYLNPEVFIKVPNFAIVRNPYSRMVSIYMYNRFGRLESFDHFVRSWYKMMKYYRESREMEEWFTPCHGIPQFEYTHRSGKQLVQSIVRQEELKLLKNNGLATSTTSVSNLPDVVLRALLTMPHTNQRATEKKWHQYYTQETLDLVYDLYKGDFETFGYPTLPPNRPDLHSPAAKIIDETGSNLQDTTSTRRVSSRGSSIESTCFDKEDLRKSEDMGPPETIVSFNHDEESPFGSSRDPCTISKAVSLMRYFSSRGDFHQDLLEQT